MTSWTSHRPTPLLGGLSPAAFMRRHWQKKPLLVRGALRRSRCPASTGARLFALAARDDVESRLVVRDGERWSLRPGPIARRACRRWRRRAGRCWCRASTCTTTRRIALLPRFRFVPDARLDDVMVSYASDGGGVGPHVDSYDVFLLQVAGRRRWRIGRVARPRLRDDVPLKMLRRLRARARSGCSSPATCSTCRRAGATTASPIGECITASIGFRAPAARRARAPTRCSGWPRRARRDRRRRPAAGRDPLLRATRAQPATDRAGAHSRRAAALRRRGDASALLADAPRAAARARRGAERAQARHLVRARRRRRALGGGVALDRRTPHALRRRASSSSTASRSGPAAAMPH